MWEVQAPELALGRLDEIIGTERTERLLGEDVVRGQEVFANRKLLNVNSTAVGGGVAEMLQVLVAYTNGLGLDSHWLVIDGEPEFFEITKRLHNHLYGQPGDGGPLGDREAEQYQRVLEAQRDRLTEWAGAGDLVILHDPQVAGLAAATAQTGARVVWRCHVGIDSPNEWSELGWAFLRQFLDPHVDAYVFSRREFAPSWIEPDALAVISPSIDPFSVKNTDLSAETVSGILARSGIVAGTSGPVDFPIDGRMGRVERQCDFVREGPAPDPSTPLVVQVSRWDPMKDMAGVMRAFIDHVLPSTDAHLMLVGPSVSGVSDDPEAAQVFEACRADWAQLPLEQRQRVDLVLVPMDDPDENAAIVNALQRHATVVTQKSIAEGFGLTVTEAMFKGVPVVAATVGGIVDQIEDGVSGYLTDPSDLEGFGARIVGLLDDDDLAHRIGAAGRQRIIDCYLADSHLRNWLDVCDALLT